MMTVWFLQTSVSFTNGMEGLVKPFMSSKEQYVFALPQ